MAQQRRRRGRKPAPAPGAGRPSRGQRRRDRVEESEPVAELRSLAGRRADKAVAAIVAAADAYAAGRERDALRLLRPLTDAYPDAAGVRELAGLAHYRLGHWNAAARELEVFADLSRSTEQHPVLMDCERARRRWRAVDARWEELRVASPSASLVAEGRIVAAGALADQGRLDEAIALLERRSEDLARPKAHHLRTWYALADLVERAGDVPHARALFRRVARHDPRFADVAERLSTLGGG